MKLLKLFKDGTTEEITETYTDEQLHEIMRSDPNIDCIGEEGVKVWDNGKWVYQWEVQPNNFNT